LATGDVACHQKGAQAQQQSLFFLDESGFYPLPSVVRTYAPVGQTPILEEWWTRDHLSAISAISPEGKLYFHDQDGAITSEDVVAFLEHLLPRGLPSPSCGPRFGHGHDSRLSVGSPALSRLARVGI